RAHRIAHHIGAGDREVIEQPAGILHHRGRLVGLRLVELRALPMPAIVIGDDAVAVAAEQADPTGIKPIVLDARCEAMHQQHRLAGTFVDEADAYALRSEAVHSLRPPAWCPATLPTPIISPGEQLSFARLRRTRAGPPWQFR